MGDNTDILKLQKSFIWLLCFNNLRKRTSHNFFRTSECMEKPFRTHLLSREYNHNVYAKAPAHAYSFHELGDEASLVVIATILSELRLLIQQ
jgi:hypothetical protein